MRTIIASGFLEAHGFYYKIRPNIRPALNTNGILFSNPKYLWKLVKLVEGSPLPRKQISLSFSNISDPGNPKNKKESMKIQGISNILWSDFWNTRIFLSVIVTKDNYEKLPEIGEFITSSIHRKYALQGVYRYPIPLPRSWFQKSGIRFAQANTSGWCHISRRRKNMERFILHLFHNKLSVSLKNVPICNLSPGEMQKLDFTKHRGEKRLGNMSTTKLDESFISDFFSWDRLVRKSHPECQKCSKEELVPSRLNTWTRRNSCHSLCSIIPAKIHMTEMAQTLPLLVSVLGIRIIYDDHRKRIIENRFSILMALFTLPYYGIFFRITRISAHQS